jgi:hypothetical protein
MERISNVQFRKLLPERIQALHYAVDDCLETVRSHEEPTVAYLYLQRVQGLDSRIDKEIEELTKLN